MNIKTRPPIARMSRILGELRAGRMVNCQRIAKDLEVCPKTIQRDLDFMRDRLGIPIFYDPSRYCYQIRGKAGASLL